MSTRGFVGFAVDGQVKVTYNHSDSYPSWLGAQVLKFLQSHLPADFDDLVTKAKALEVIDEDVPPTEEQKKRLERFADLGVSERSLDDWYCLLRNTQGDLDLILEAGTMADGSHFPLESLFCEWGYLIDLDNRVLEVYEGFKEDLPTRGRWAGRPTATENAEEYQQHLNWCAQNGREPWATEIPKYKAVDLIATFPFGEGLPDEETFLKIVTAASRYPDDEA